MFCSLIPTFLYPLCYIAYTLWNANYTKFSRKKIFGLDNVCNGLKEGYFHSFTVEWLHI